MPADLRRWTMALGGTAALVMPTAGHWYATGHFYGGLAMIAAGMIVDIATTPSAVHRANRPAAQGLRVTGIAPTLGGFAVTGTF